ncbi:MAG: Deoxyribose-phosphate aldolase [Candidatus Ordinivivax streblomastigis]|uniref:Deoxyribose-phosphate aldolase n=1 Tax=Candidatus Ordinivivax streblomastigis TaxID=2540710 RepID=A0A5M8P346_9BACT|nr:MAG: Deoxyribose-phosphate aldolase [Candidatus Ordinivivax streblomastigis]
MSKYEEALHKFNLNLQGGDVSRKTAEIIGKTSENLRPEVLKFLYSCIDLTSLRSEDSKESIWKFVEKVNDLDGSRTDMGNVAAICVYPNFVSTVKEALRADVKIASVAGGFPSSQTFMEIKIAEASLAIADGANEIDIVLNCGEFLDNNLEEVCEEIIEIKDACRDVRLKVILETGLLKTAGNIKKASILSMYSGADFIKTSTGKIYSGASPEAVYVMCEAIKEYDQLNHRKVGIKVSGGIRTAQEAVQYYTIVKEILGEAWLTPDYFRIGASSLTHHLLQAL